MQLLFLDKYCPGAFRPMLRWLQTTPEHSAYFMSEYRRKDFALGKTVHVPVRVGAVARRGNPTEEALLHMARRAEAFAHAMRRLKAEGMAPDVICGNGSNGCTLYAPEVFPGVPLMGAFEWYSPPAAMHQNMLPGDRFRCLFQLAAMQSCSVLFTGTRSQRDSYPEPWRSRMTLLPEGVDVEYFAPGPGGRVRFPGAEGSSEIVTYIARTLSRQGAFDTFYKALQHILQARKGCHALIVGYPEKKVEGKEDFFEALMQAVPLDRNRVHFINFCSHEEYRAILRASQAHVFLSRVPRAVPSGLLEAMSCGCLIVASDNTTVREVLHDGENALLTDVNDPQALAATVIRVLEGGETFAPLRSKARAVAVEHHNAAQLEHAYVNLLQMLVK